MVQKRRFVEEREGEEYLHKETWRVVVRQFDRPENPKCGALYDDLVAMVFAAHTLEGYINFVGDKILPEIWKEEDKIKGGLEGKLALILKECQLTDFVKGQRPYSTVIALCKLRNKIAHPKTYKPKSCKEYAEGKEPPRFQKTYLETVVSHEEALRARDDIKSIVDRIHAAAAARFPDRLLGKDGLSGIISHHTSGRRMQE